MQKFRAGTRLKSRGDLLSFVQTASTMRRLLSLLVVFSLVSSARAQEPSPAAASEPVRDVRVVFHGDRRFDKAGVLAMANHGANTNGSQFFFLLGPAPHLNDDSGNGHYTIFGQVTKGQEIVDAITQSDHVKSVDILDPTGPLFAKEAEQIEKWNKQMTKPAKH